MLQNSGCSVLAECPPATSTSAVGHAYPTCRGDIPWEVRSEMEMSVDEVHQGIHGMNTCGKRAAGMEWSGMEWPERGRIVRGRC